MCSKHNHNMPQPHTHVTSEPSPPSRVHYPFSRLLRHFWEDDFNLFGDSNWPAKVASGTNLSLAEDDHKIYIEAALPGLSEEEMEITLEKGYLWIRGEKRETEDHKKYHRKASSSYSYTIALPDSVDETAEPETRYHNGVLYITFSKVKSAGAKRIPIKRS